MSQQSSTSSVKPKKNNYIQPQKTETPKNDGLLVKNGVQVDILEKLRINQKPTSA
jgi:hypothetical protein